MLQEIKGPYDVLFAGRTDYARVNVDYVQVSIHGDIICLVDTAGAIYNWSNVLVMRKARNN